jgi:hypothetical protein
MSGRTIYAAGVALVAGVLGCGSSYVYTPAEHATAGMLGRPAAFYPLPTQNPQGDVRVASFGISKLKGANMPKDARALHVRMVVSNESARTWSIDTSEQVAQLHSGRMLRPTFVQSNVAGVPSLQIQPNGKVTLDLFYLLPVEEAKASQIPSFDVLWRVNTGGDHVVAQRTPFERLRIEPVYASAVGYYGYGLGWGPYGWYDPFWGPATLGVPGWYW